MALNDFRAVFFPYCLEKQPDGRYVVLNREYKPVGFNTYEWIKYEDFPVAVWLSMTPLRASKLSFKGSKDTDHIFLYDDGSNPVRSKANMKAYLSRLELLGAYEVNKKKRAR